MVAGASPGAGAVGVVAGDSAGAVGSGVGVADSEGASVGSPPGVGDGVTGSEGWSAGSPEGDGWSDGGIARAIRAVARADADIKGAASDASYTLERLVLTVTGLREGR